MLIGFEPWSGGGGGGSAATTIALTLYAPASAARHAQHLRRRHACDVLIADPFINEIVSDMADRRKLQGEIDRCLKKIIEGVDVFEDIWQKGNQLESRLQGTIQAAPNCNIKEKHEADLKKEIKKLQRLRDGLKAWVASSDIKDKKVLLEYKKLIEVQMERFKVIERETKTKAYSKEGLGTATKIDPKEKEKEDITNWLANSIEELNVQIDQFETEVENVGAKKKKLDKDKQDQVDGFRHHLDKHRFHIDQLETIMRLVDNDALEIEQIAKIKDDVEYYIASGREPDFEENEFLYDDLHLAEISAALGSKLAATSLHDEDTTSETSETTSVQNSSSPSPSPSLINPHSKDSSEDDGGRMRLKASISCDSSRQPSGPSSVYNRSVSSSARGAADNNTSGGSSSKQLSMDSSTGGPGKQIHSFDKTSLAQTGSSGISSTTSLSSGQNYAQAAGLMNHHQHQVLHRPATSPSDKPVSNAFKSGVPTSSGSTAPVALTGTISVSCPSTTTFFSGDSLSSPSTVDLTQRQQTTTTTQQSTIPGPLAGVGAHQQAQTWASGDGTGSASHPISLTWAAEGDLNLNPFTRSPQSSLPMGANALLSLAANARNQVQSEAHLRRSSLSSVTCSEEDSGSVKMNGLLGGDDSEIQTSSQQNSSTGLDSVEDSLSGMNRLGLDSSGFGSTNNDATNVQLTRSTPNEKAGSTSPITSPVVSPLHPTSAAGGSGGGMDPTVDYQSLIVPPRPPPTMTSTIRLHPLLGVAPLGTQPLDRLNMLQLAMLDAAAMHLPQPDDSERIRTYFPRSPAVVPSYYSQLSSQISDSMDYFNRLHIETLFFIFYYVEGTKAQYMAAKALKLKSWRFHTKLLMWFQRHEEPKIITEEFEQGSYLYFDYEKWVQRQHEGFTFEYKYLEDHDLN